MINGFFLFKVISLYLYFGLTIDELRSNYPKAIDHKEICLNMIEKLEDSEMTATQQAYLGGFQTIWANHVFNPIQKLKTFNKGKKNIEEGIRRDPNNMDIRFVRLSVQMNCPAFLGYNQHIDSDRKILEDQMPIISSLKLKEMVQGLLTKVE